MNNCILLHGWDALISVLATLILHHGLVDMYSVGLDSVLYRKRKTKTCPRRLRPFPWQILNRFVRARDAPRRRGGRWTSSPGSALLSPIGREVVDNTWKRNLIFKNFLKVWNSPEYACQRPSPDCASNKCPFCCLRWLCRPKEKFSKVLISRFTWWSISPSITPSRIALATMNSASSGESRASCRLTSARLIC